MDDILQEEVVVQDEEQEIVVPEPAEEENLIKKGGEDERESFNKSDDIIRGSNAIDNLRSITTFELDGYDSTILWEQSNKNIGFTADTFSISDLSSYDLFSVVYKRYRTESDLYQVFFKYETGPGFSCIGASYSGEYARRVKTNLSSISIDYCYKIGTNTQDTNICTPIYIIGYKKQEVVIPEPTPTPTPEQTTSGNTIINNNYYGVVSDSSLSWNILNKPLNSYSPAESMCALSILLTLFFVIFLGIRKAVFRWK